MALGRTVAELEQSITENELTQWMAYYRREPFGDIRADLRSAQICALLANINRDTKKRQAPFKIEDFLLFREVPERKQSVDEMKKVFMQMVAQQKGKR